MCLLDNAGPSGFTRFLTLDHGEWLTQRGPPAKFLLYTIGNPLIAITMLEHDVEAGLDVPVRLAIYDLLGRQVARLVDGTLEAGAHTVEVDAGALPSGVYVYRLDTGARHQVRRVVVVR